jgi:hypothetical protein
MLTLLLTLMGLLLQPLRSTITLTPLWEDVNLDGTPELLLIISSREQSALGVFGWDKHGLRATWVDLEIEDTSFVMPVWRAEMYPVKDSLHRVYMAVYTPDKGGEVYVGGLIVVRWDNWKPEIVLHEDDVCPVLPWEVNAAGALVIPLTSPFPWQGCTVRRSGELVIDDAYFSPTPS